MRIESLKKSELVNYCQSLGIQTFQKNMNDLQREVYLYRKNEIDISKKNATDLDLLKYKIRELADEYANNLNHKIINRRDEMR